MGCKICTVVPENHENVKADEACIRLFKSHVLRWMQAGMYRQAILHVHTADLAVRNRKYTIDRWLRENNLRVSYAYDAFQCIHSAYVTK